MRYEFLYIGYALQLREGPQHVVSRNLTGRPLRYPMRPEKPRPRVTTGVARYRRPLLAQSP
jgi:hypothetical protein